MNALKALFASLLILFSFANAFAVTGGKELQPEEFRQTVALTYKVSEAAKLAEIFCSGTLIGPSLVLSAGHCIKMGAAYYKLSEAEFLKHVWIYIGDSPSARDIPLVQPNVKVASAKWNFDPAKSKLDISLLKLQEPVDLTAYKITPTAMLPYKQIDQATQVTTVGYGVLKFGAVKGLKRKFTAKVSSKTVDRFSVGKTGTDNSSACHGDSGGSTYSVDKDGKVFFAGVTLEIEVGDECGRGKTFYQGFTPSILQWIDQARK